MSVLIERWLAIPGQRRKRLVLVLLALSLIGGILWAAQNVLWPYILGLALAYILAPVVTWLERFWRWVGKHRRLRFFGRIARALAIVFTYLLLAAILVGFFSLVSPLVIQQGKALWAERETVLVYLSGLTDSVIEQYQLLPPQVQMQIEQTLGRFGDMVGKIVEQALQGTAVAFSYTVSLVLAIFIVPFWTFYLLLDSQRLGNAVLDSIPGQIREDVLKIVALVDSAVGAYLRGQLLLGLIIGVITTIALSLMGVRFSLVLGLVAGVFELIPNIGPLLGGIPSVLVALTQNPTLALFTAIFVVGIQQVENLFLTPRVLGRSVKLHPVLVMVVLVVGSEIGGLVGLFLAPVVTAVLRDVFRYLYYRMSDEPLSPEAALGKVWKTESFSVEL